MPEFLVNDESLGTVRNLKREEGYDKYETKIYLGGRKVKHYSGHEPSHISFLYQGEWPSCGKSDVWKIGYEDGHSEVFLPTDIIDYGNKNSLVKGEVLNDEKVIYS